MVLPRWLYGLLVLSVLTVVLSFLPVPPLLLFVVASLGLIPLAGLVGQSVERIAEHTGEMLGGLLLATFGNATELVIGIFALLEGLIDVVRASIIGAVLCNVLLVLGIAISLGSFKHGRLSFARRPASQYASLLSLCVTGLVLPAIAVLFASRAGQPQVVERGLYLSVAIAGILLVGYVLSIMFSVFHVGDSPTQESGFQPVLGKPSEEALTRIVALRKGEVPPSDAVQSQLVQSTESAVQVLTVDHSKETAQAVLSEKELVKEVETTVPLKSPLLPAIVVLALSTIGVAWLSEILVGTIEPFTSVLGWNQAFVGLVFLPLVSALPDFLNTSRMALNKRIDMVLAATAGSSIQIALLVAPVLVLVSLLTNPHLNLLFSIVELAVLGLGTFLYAEITEDGELVWLEGALLILIYAVMAVTVFLFGA
jgi:Ca2+:H+ antiporter